MQWQRLGAVTTPRFAFSAVLSHMMFVASHHNSCSYTTVETSLPLPGSLGCVPIGSISSPRSRCLLVGHAAMFDELDVFVIIKQNRWRLSGAFFRWMTIRSKPSAIWGYLGWTMQCIPEIIWVQLHPWRKFTWTPKIPIVERTIIFQSIILGSSRQFWWDLLEAAVDLRYQWLIIVLGRNYV